MPLHSGRLTGRFKVSTQTKKETDDVSPIKVTTKSGAMEQGQIDRPKAAANHAGNLVNLNAPENHRPCTGSRVVQSSDR